DAYVVEFESLRSVNAPHLVNSARIVGPEWSRRDSFPQPPSVRPRIPWACPATNLNVRQYPASQIWLRPWPKVPHHRGSRRAHFHMSAHRRLKLIDGAQNAEVEILFAGPKHVAGRPNRTT